MREPMSRQEFDFYMQEHWANRKFEALIAEKIMGWTNVTRDVDGDYYGYAPGSVPSEGCDDVPHYLWYLKDMHAVVEKMRVDHRLMLQFEWIAGSTADVAVARFKRFRDTESCETLGYAESSQESVAIYTAALRALGESIV